MNNRKPLLLIVDDNEDMRLYMRTELGKHYDIIEAENGVLGYDLAIRQQPDAIISDIVMPKMDGIELLKKLKSEPSVRNIPVMMLTAKQEDETLLEGLMYGADDYIKKPFQINILKVRLKNLLDGIA